MRQVYQYDPIIGYKFIPNIKARVLHEGGGYLIRTNKSGFQCDHDFSQKKRDKIRRILLFGDSFTAGEGVSSGYRYSEWLEKLLPSVEVFNFGLPASGTDQQYLIYQEYGRNIDHDLLIISVFVENIRRVASRYRRWTDGRGKSVLYEKPFFKLLQDRLHLFGVPPNKKPIKLNELARTDRRHIASTSRFPAVKKVYNWTSSNEFLKGICATREFKDSALKLLRYQPIKEYDDPCNGAWLLMRAIIQQWIGGHEKPVMLVPIPMFHYVAGISNPYSYRMRLRDAVEESGGHYFDPLNGMIQPSIKRCYSLFFNDGHLTREGHRLLAETITPEVKAILEMSQRKQKCKN